MALGDPEPAYPDGLEPDHPPYDINSPSLGPGKSYKRKSVNKAVRYCAFCPVVMTSNAYYCEDCKPHRNSHIRKTFDAKRVVPQDGAVSGLAGLVDDAETLGRAVYKVLSIYDSPEGKRSRSAPPWLYEITTAAKAVEDGINRHVVPLICPAEVQNDG